MDGEFTEGYKGNDKSAIDAETRLKRGHKDKERHKKRLDDYYRLVMPWRTQIDGEEFTDDYVDDIFDNTAIDANADFASDMLATFTPFYTDWIDPVPSIELNDADKEVVKPQIQSYNKGIFGEIRRSNFHSEALECYEDLSGGTMAMLIQDVDIAQPIYCESIPVTNIIIARGPFKNIDTLAYDTKLFADRIPVLWPSAENNKELMKEISDAGGKEISVRHTIWRDYSNKATEAYKYVVYTKNHMIEEGTYEGEGSCPLIIGRWKTDNTTAWGIGAGYLQLPNIKTANLLKELILKNLDYAVDPATAYDDDGTINMEHGLLPGTHIPKQIGSEIQVLQSGSNFDAGYFEQQELGMQIKRGYYQDKPTQLGKTPPSATQFLEEAAANARRMGAPAGRLVVEWQYPIYKRFAYLLSKRGKLPDVKLNGEVVSLNPTSPLIRAQRQERALQLQRFLGVLQEALGPELASLVVEQAEAAYSLADDMGIELKNLKPKDVIRETINQVQQAAAAGEIA